uniref:Uncharacterized protein n=1 Tax=Trypanosoma vivax (strain Y486) TaxID=1055687 RepID=G0UD17_TRYVY|nr:hypothetical protein, conserved in T. vivax [Trypanosoma vivax Y486]
MASTPLRSPAFPVLSTRAWSVRARQLSLLPRSVQSSVTDRKRHSCTGAPRNRLPRHLSRCPVLPSWQPLTRLLPSPCQPCLQRPLPTLRIVAHLFAPVCSSLSTLRLAPRFSFQSLHGRSLKLSCALPQKPAQCRRIGRPISLPPVASSVGNLSPRWPANTLSCAIGPFPPPAAQPGSVLRALACWSPRKCAAARHSPMSVLFPASAASPRLLSFTASHASSSRLLPHAARCSACYPQCARRFPLGFPFDLPPSPLKMLLASLHLISGRQPPVARNRVHALRCPAVPLRFAARPPSTLVADSEPHATPLPLHVRAR